MHAIIQLDVNGDRYQTGVPMHYTLLETLRYALGLTGSKQGCDKGDCGACTVLLDGEPVLACLTPVLEAEGRRITTVEGLAGAGEPHPLQAAFGEHGAAQCGFCTPGILMSAHALLQRNPSPTRQEIREALAGNLCRCTGYTKIYQAIEKAAEALRADAMPVGVSAGGGSARGARNVGGASAQDAFDRRHPADPPDSPEEIVAASRSDGRDACAAGNADRNV